jgi:hypothetical protein
VGLTDVAVERQCRDEVPLFKAFRALFLSEWPISGAIAIQRDSHPTTSRRQCSDPGAGAPRY